MKDFGNLSYVAGHETGHLLKLPHAEETYNNPHYFPDPAVTTRLMLHNGAGSTASRLIKYEWDIVKPINQP